MTPSSNTRSGGAMSSITGQLSRALLGSAILVAAACSLPFTKSSDERKAECDKIAAAAIQTSSLEEAKNLSAQASSCYANLQTR